MKTAIFAMLLFLAAFLCMAAGVIMGRKSLRGGCGGGPQTKEGCKKSKCECSDGRTG